MKQIVHFLRKRIFSENIEGLIAAISCYTVALFFFIITILKLPHLGLDEKQLFLGVLLICSLTGQICMAGLMCEMYRELKKKSKES